MTRRFLLCVLLALFPLQLLAAPYAFISSSTQQGQLIDLATDRVVATIPLGRGAYSVVWHPDGTRIYVSNYLDSTISVITVDPNAPSGATTTSLIRTDGGVTTLGMDPDGQYLTVTSSAGTGAPPESNKISVYRLSDNSFVSATTIPGPVGMVIRNGVVYVTSTANNNVVRLALPSLANLGSQATGSTPVAIAMNPAGTALFVANFQGASVSVISVPGFGGAPIATVPVGRFPGAIAVSPDGSKAYVTTVGNNTVSIIDTRTFTVTNTVPVLANPYAVAFHPAGSYAYVVNNGSASYSKIDTRSETVVATVPVLASPTGLPSFVSPAYPPPSCTLAASPASILAGQSATLTATCNPAATSYSWSGAGCEGTTGRTCTVRPSATTTYSVTGSNVAGGTGNTATATVSVSAPPAPAVRTLGSRGTVTPSATLYGGFQLSAPTTVYILVRGNSLGTLGVTQGFLDAPRVRVYNAQGQDMLSDINGPGFNGCTTTSNSGSAVVSYYTSVRGAPPHTRDGCTALSLATGVYTFSVTPSTIGVTSTPSSGEILFEVTLGGGTGSAASTLGSRATVSRTAPLYGGFELAGPATVLVLVRGNSLSTLGITQNYLDAPRVRLFNAQGQDMLSDINGPGVNGCSTSVNSQAPVVTYYTSVRGVPPSGRDGCTYQVFPAGAYTFSVTPSTQGVLSSPGTGETLFEVVVQ